MLVALNRCRSEGREAVVLKRIIQVYLRQPRCESTNELPKIDELFLGGNCKWSWRTVFISRAQEGKSWGNKEDFDCRAKNEEGF